MVPDSSSFGLADSCEALVEAAGAPSKNYFFAGQILRSSFSY